MDAMKSSEEDVVLQGIEFWSNVCEEEIALAVEAEEVPPSPSLTNPLPIPGGGTRPAAGASEQALCARRVALSHAVVNRMSRETRGSG